MAIAFLGGLYSQLAGHVSALSCKALWACKGNICRRKRSSLVSKGCWEKGVRLREYLPRNLPSEDERRPRRGW